MTVKLTPYALENILRSTAKLRLVVAAIPSKEESRMQRASDAFYSAFSSPLNGSTGKGKLDYFFEAMQHLGFKMPAPTAYATVKEGNENRPPLMSCGWVDIRGQVSLCLTFNAKGGYIRMLENGQWTCYNPDENGLITIHDMTPAADNEIQRHISTETMFEDNSCQSTTGALLSAGILEEVKEKPKPKKLRASYTDTTHEDDDDDEG